MRIEGDGVVGAWNFESKNNVVRCFRWLVGCASRIEIGRESLIWARGGGWATVTFRDGGSTWV